MCKLKARIAKSTNHDFYLLLDYAGCIAAKISSKNYGTEFTVTPEQAKLAFTVVVGGEERIDFSHWESDIAEKVD